MGKIRDFFRNRWVKFGLVAFFYLLFCVIWTGNPWMLLGLPVIYDIYISKWFYRKWGYRHTELRKSSKTYNSLMGWVDPILFAVVAATLIRMFFFELYKIPTPSMEKTLLVGDYLAVSKLSYGPKVPNTPIAFPLVHHTMPLSETKKSFVEWVCWPYHRLRGFGTVERNDVVVFNFPTGDTVLLNNQQIDYHAVVREIGWRQTRAMSEVVYRPVDKRENYVKRCVAVPGETIEIRNGQVYVDGEPQEAISGREYTYFVITNGTPFNITALEELGISRSDVTLRSDGNYVLPLTDQAVAKIRTFGNVRDVVRYESTEPSPACFPHDARYPWTEDNFGPLWVPNKGTAVKLTADNLPLFERIIRVYEGNELEVREGDIYINGERTDSYIFRMDYYFMMGDNRHNSLDSRFWGFVPEDHIVGKPAFTWLSVDPEKGFFSGLRWNRMFRKIR